ncbi:MAG: hypothetical protein IJR07_11145 [Bacteroidaceae bacterium]|nr:hypothetical protein [Bacteroidaceae bacterium]
MRTWIIIFCALFATCWGYAQEREIKMPEAPRQSRYTEFSLREKGYWWATDLSIGQSITFHEKDLLTAGFTFVNGYRFNDYLRIGVGIGVQYHAINSDEIRNTDIRWTMPMFFNVRGNFMSQEVREIVPCWSADVGFVVGDGVMFTPSFGFRFGERRSAFLLNLGYSFRTIKAKHGFSEKRNYVLLKIGYEF